MFMCKSGSIEEELCLRTAMVSALPCRSTGGLLEGPGSDIGKHLSTYPPPNAFSVVMVLFYYSIDSQGSNETDRCKIASQAVLSTAKMQQFFVLGFHKPRDSGTR